MDLGEGIAAVRIFAGVVALLCPVVLFALARARRRPEAATPTPPTE